MKMPRIFQRKPHLHPCDICYKMMRVNGYGMCEVCLTVFENTNGTEWVEYLSKTPRFSKEVK